MIYQDDVLLLDQNKERLGEHTAIALAVLEALGFLVNYPKSSLIPDQEITFLGFVINSRDKTLSLPREKVAALKQQAKAMSKKKLVSARTLAQLIGKMSAALIAVRPAPLHYCSLQHLKHKALRKRGYDTIIPISSKAHQDLHWWSQNLSIWNGRLAKDPDLNLIIETDASKQGWGASCQGVMTGGCWSREEANLHINVLEMMAAFFAIQAFTKHLQGVRILLRTDNTSVVANINHMGGTRSPQLIALVKELWSWCLRQKTTIIAQHLPGLENVTADFLSRHISDRTDWMLDPSIFHCIDSLMGPLQVDLFATRFTKQLPRFYSWRPDPEAEETDAFMQDWSKALGFAHPPWCLISRVLGKIKMEKATVVLITPLWQTQAWFPTLIEMIIDFPIMLPRQEILDPSPSSRRVKTNSNYDSSWRSWDLYCRAHSLCPFSTTLPHVLDFLAEKYHAGLAYRSLNRYRSALSSAMLPIDGFQVGQHPHVSRLLRAVFNSRPPQPKYSETWEVSKVLSYVRSLGSNEALSLKFLTRKLVVLLALVLASHCSDLIRLTLKGRKYSAGGAELKCNCLSKTAKPGQEKCTQSVHLVSFDQDLLLCPVRCLKAYEGATAKFRQKDASQLFLTTVEPHQPVTSSSIARWLKQAIAASGISGDFSAHSTRGASSTAAAMNGLTIRGHGSGWLVQ